MAKPLSPFLTTAGLLGGFAAARYSGNRRVGGVLWGVAGLICLARWRRAGWLRAVGLLSAYAGGMGASHPLAKKMGAWPSVALVSAGMAAAAWVFGERPAEAS